jgi:hypothetical protein
MIRRGAVLIAFAALTSACQFSENRYITRPVARAELLGRWRATEFAIKSLRDIGVRERLRRDDHVLVFNADGSCVLRTIVNMPPFEGADYKSYETGCRWRLSSDTHQQVTFELTPAPAAAPYYYFAEENGKLLLWQHAADPDAWRYMEFERVVAVR